MPISSTRCHRKMHGCFCSVVCSDGLTSFDQCMFWQHHRCMAECSLQSRVLFRWMIHQIIRIILINHLSLLYLTFHLLRLHLHADCCTQHRLHVPRYVIWDLDHYVKFVPCHEKSQSCCLLFLLVTYMSLE